MQFWNLNHGSIVAQIPELPKPHAQTAGNSFTCCLPSIMKTTTQAGPPFASLPVPFDNPAAPPIIRIAACRSCPQNPGGQHYAQWQNAQAR
jgi:hypothetical protein